MRMPELWSFHDEALAGIDLQGFEVRARDGSIGRVVQAVQGRAGGYLVVDPGAAMPLGRQLLVPAGLVEGVDVDERRVAVQVEREQVRNAPEYDPRRPLDDPPGSVFGDYFHSLMADASRRGGVQRAPTRSRQARSTRTASGRGRAKASSPRSRTRSSAADSGPTKDELYKQAKRLDISGRSKMNKPQLARAVGRRRGQTARSGSATKANPVDVQAFLERVGYPAGKRKLLSQAEKQRASRKVRETLERLPEKRFKSPTDVSKAIGKLD